MIQALKQVSKEHSKLLYDANVITIHENYNNHGDFLTVSFLLDALLNGKDVTFLAVRQNYAHFLALSKKLGKSIEQFGKNGKLTYYQAFATQLNSQLPLCESSPATYARPPKFVTVLTQKNLQNIKIKPHSIFIIDCISFIDHLPSVCYFLYEQAILAKCRIIIGGCSLHNNVSKIFKKEAEINFQLQNDVSGHGRFTLKESINNIETCLLWKWYQGKFQLSKFVKI